MVAYLTLIKVIRRDRLAQHCLELVVLQPSGHQVLGQAQVKLGLTRHYFTQDYLTRYP